MFTLVSITNHQAGIRLNMSNVKVSKFFNVVKIHDCLRDDRLSIPQVPPDYSGFAEFIYPPEFNEKFHGFGLNRLRSNNEPIQIFWESYFVVNYCAEFSLLIPANL